MDYIVYVGEGLLIVFFLLAINKHRERETETHFFIGGLTPRKILRFFFSHFPLPFFEKTSLSPRSFQVPTSEIA
jgi:hypothetical protein